ncbi:unnamed protein product [Amoebophrya sp. A25]|nr:unnamed protein product [Amoebophrya sp. A25]|eukprot:GSA25T00005290001.1
MPTSGPVMTMLNATQPGGPRVTKTKSQLKREERVSIFGLDCVDSVLISGWQIGKEVHKTITIRNVSLTTQKLNYDLPKSEAFQLEYPKGWALAPGTTVTIKLVFRPLVYEPHLDYVTVRTPTGQFSILLKAVVTELALSIPPFVDFGYGPVQETVVIPVPMHNTGSLPVRYEWGFGEPFVVAPFSSDTGSAPAEGVLNVGESRDIEIEFRPKEAKTYEAILRVKVLTDHSGGMPRTEEAEREMKFYELRVIGAGKVPHLIPVGTDKLELGPILPTQNATVKFRVQNVSLVRANAILRPLQDEIPPLAPCAIQYFPERVIIEPGQRGEVEFRYASNIVGETCARDFELVSPGGAPLRVSVKGSCVAPEVEMSTSYVNFGELDCSQDPARVYDRAMQRHKGKLHDPGMKVLRIDNKSPLKVHYHFCNVDQLYSVFALDKPSGTLAPHGYVLITINFSPMAPINYYKRLYCVFKNGPLRALPLDLLGTGYTDEQRPAVLQQDDVLQWHQVRLLGYPEYDSRPSSPSHSEHEMSPFASSGTKAGATTPFSRGTPGKEEEDGEHGSPVRSVSPKKTYHNFLDRVFPRTLKKAELSSMQTFLECVYPPKDMSLTPSELDFFGAAGVRTVTLTNNTNQKVIACWMNLNETRLPSNLAKFGEADFQTFTVYPNNVDIPAQGEMEFTVTYRPSKEMTFDGQVLECYVFPKRNRSFHLVNKKKFTPPTCLNLVCQGHTMGFHRDDCQVEITDSSHVVRMQPCALMQRSYHVFLIKNLGDTKMVYRILPAMGEKVVGEDVPFSCFPRRGCIYPHSFHAIVIEFAPTKADNGTAFEAKIPIIINYEESNYRYVRVHARCWQTKLELKNLITFPLTCQGNNSDLQLAVRNEAEVGAHYEIKIPTRYRQIFHVEESEGVVGPGEKSAIKFRFTPDAPGLFSTSINVQAQEIRDADDDRRIFAIQDREYFGPLPIEDVAAIADFNGGSHPGGRKTYAIQLVGHGQQPALSLEANMIDLGPLTAGRGDATKSQIRVFNSSNQEVHFRLEVEFEFEKLEMDRSPLRKSIEQMRSPKGSVRDGRSTPLSSPRRTDRYTYPPSPQPPKDPKEDNEDDPRLFKNSLVFEINEGSVGPRGFLDLRFTVSLRRRGIHQWTVKVVPVAFHHPLGSEVAPSEFTVRADAQSPLVQISDVRQESPVPQPVSMLWTYCQVDDFNMGQRMRPSHVDRKFQSALGFDARRVLLPQLGSYQLNFGTAPYGNAPTVVYLVLTNPTDVPVDFDLHTPGDLQLQDVPLWHDEIPPWHRGTSQGGSKSADEPSVEEQRLAMAEHHYEWVENHKVLDVYPKAARIEPGEFQFVRFMYQHFSVGTHILPFVLTVTKGKSMVFYCKANTLPPNIGRLSVRANAITLRPVPIGYERGPLQVIELSNCGSAPACWSLNAESLDELKEENYGFPLLQISPMHGELAPRSRIFLHCYFTPIEAKAVECSVKIDLTLGDGTVVETLDFELRMSGFDPKRGQPPTEYLTPPFGPTLPLQTYAPLPNYGAALSCEAVDFGVVPLDSVNTKVVALVNYSKDSVLNFQWNTASLFRNAEEFSITPESGTLYPGTHQMILFRLHCVEGPLELVGDLECRISWELMHPPAPPGPDPWEKEVTEEEVFAAHTDTIHEATYDPRNFANRHVSVVNRLTVARFRALMSTAAGQKYLNRSLDRTALLSSHISNLTPRRAYKKLEREFMRTREQEMKTDDLDRENLGFSQVLSESFNSQGGANLSAMNGGQSESLASFPLFVRLSVACRAEESSQYAVALSREKHIVKGGDSPPKASSKIQSEVSHQPSGGASLGATSSMVISQPSETRTGIMQHGGSKSSTSPSGGAANANFELVHSNIVQGMRVFLEGEGFREMLAQQLSQPAPNFAQLDATSAAQLRLLEGLPELRPKQRTDEVAPIGGVVAGSSSATSSSVKKKKMAPSAFRSAFLMDFAHDRDIFTNIEDEVDIPGPAAASAAADEVVVDENTRGASTSAVGVEANTKLLSASSAAGAEGEPPDPVLAAEQYWDETMRMYGHLRLENFFQNCASHVLEHTVLKITDETISGRFNWAKLHLGDADELGKSTSQNKEDTIA